MRSPILFASKKKLRKGSRLDIECNGINIEAKSASVLSVIHTSKCDVLLFFSVTIQVPWTLQINEFDYLKKGCIQLKKEKKDKQGVVLS